MDSKAEAPGPRGSLTSMVSDGMYVMFAFQFVNNNNNSSNRRRKMSSWMIRDEGL